MTVTGDAPGVAFFAVTKPAASTARNCPAASLLVQVTVEAAVSTVSPAPFCGTANSGCFCPANKVSGPPGWRASVLTADSRVREMTALGDAAESASGWVTDACAVPWPSEVG